MITNNLLMVVNMKKRILLFILFLPFFNMAMAFDHGHHQLNKILQTHLKQEGQQTYFNYSKLKESPALLNNYLDEISSVTEKEYAQFNKDQKLSFLINTYNAFTIKLIINHYPLKSIKDLGGLFSSPWKKEFIPLWGKKVSLDFIEHKTIRKNFKEARIHFAVNCASIGCPSLYKEAFIAEKLNQQLDQATIHFLSNKSKNKINPALEEIQLSKIFKWYGGDFEKYDGSVKNFILKYLNFSEDQKKHIRSEKVDVEFTEYDWNLNEWK